MAFNEFPNKLVQMNEGGHHIENLGECQAHHLRHTEGQFTIKPHPAFFRKAFSLTVNILVLSTHRANLPAE